MMALNQTVLQDIKKSFEDVHLDVKIYLIPLYTANVMSVKDADVFLRSKSKSNHWLFLHSFVCD